MLRPDGVLLFMIHYDLETFTCCIWTHNNLLNSSLLI
jgi:hypothetical protein